VRRLLELGAALEYSADLQGAQTRREEARALARVLGERALELRGEAEFAACRSSTDPSFTAEQSLELGHTAVEELTPLGDDRALAAAWKLVAVGENMRANWTGYESAIEHVLEHARRAGDRRLEAEALADLSATLYWGPTPVADALPRLEAMLEDAAGDKALEVRITRAIAGLHGMEGRFDEARRLLAHARATAEDLNRPHHESTSAFFSAPLELVAGDAAAAEHLYRHACDTLEAAGEKGFLSTLAAGLADTLYVLGRLEDAEAETRRSRDAATSDDHSAQAQWRSVEAKILARRGRLDEAEALGREAVALIDLTDELNHRAQTWLALAEVLQLAHRSSEAATVAEEARRLYEQKGNAVMASRAAALRDELASPAPGARS
jgi:ATP/maltotriose-dependent transcriptional regulator MalT